MGTVAGRQSGKQRDRGGGCFVTVLEGSKRGQQRGGMRVVKISSLSF